MLEAVLQQLNNLIASYDQLAMADGNQNMEETLQVMPLNSMEIHCLKATGEFKLDFPRFNGSKAIAWVLL